MKTPVTRKQRGKIQRAARDAARAKTREAMRNGGDDRYLPARDRGPARRFCRDYVDHRFNMGEVLLPILVVILLFSFVQTKWAGMVVLVLWTTVILGTVVDEIFMVRALKKELRQRFEPQNTRGCVSYAVLRTSQLRRFRIPKPQIKRGAPLKTHY